MNALISLLTEAAQELNFHRLMFVESELKLGIDGCKK